MRAVKLLRLIVIAGIAMLVFLSIPKLFSPASVPNEPGTTQSENTDLTAIRSFSGNPDLDPTFINTDLPIPYFRVGKVTEVSGGENMEAVDDWVRRVNVYNEKSPIGNDCSVYEYHTDLRNHSLTAVIIRGLKPDQIETLRANGTPCTSDSGNIPTITKAEAETIALKYLARAVPDFSSVWDQFTYSQQQNGVSHEWLWEDKAYKLPEGLSSRPYPGPVIRISVYGNNQIQYWNTISLFGN